MTLAASIALLVRIDYHGDMTGYSSTPLIQKLGIKSGMRIVFIDAPNLLTATLGPMPEGVEILNWPFNSPEKGSLDYVHFFARDSTSLTTNISELKMLLDLAGMLWISWPKKISGIPTDLTEDVVRVIVLAQGLVDVKVVAVDDIWSGLKFVYRLRDRI